MKDDVDDEGFLSSLLAFEWHSPRTTRTGIGDEYRLGGTLFVVDSATGFEHTVLKLSLRGFLDGMLDSKFSASESVENSSTSSSVSISSSSRNTESLPIEWLSFSKLGIRQLLIDARGAILGTQSVAGSLLSNLKTET